MYQNNLFILCLRCSSFTRRLRRSTAYISGSFGNVIFVQFLCAPCASFAVTHFFNRKVRKGYAMFAKKKRPICPRARSNRQGITGFAGKTADTLPHAKRMHRRRTINLARSQYRAGKLRLIRRIRKVLRFQTKRTMLLVRMTKRLQ